ncbi:hypothetical protein KIW84_076543 [Lathyrus oleraceus]|nr:hypothetical protein KIW84_076543 [Pisum sativum]
MGHATSLKDINCSEDNSNQAININCCLQKILGSENMSGCGCGSSCNCGDSCKCNKRSSGLSYSEMETTETVILGVGPAKIQFEGAEMSAASEDGGCKCGDNCTCDPCNCK